jgi:hypothetical protein
MTVVLNYQGGSGPLDKNKMGVLVVERRHLGESGSSETWRKAVWASGDLTVSFNTAVQGVYQIRQYDVATELTLDQGRGLPADLLAQRGWDQRSDLLCHSKSKTIRRERQNH